MAASLEQLVRNQMLLREVNERIADIFGGTEEIFVGEDSLTEFLCECSNSDCTATLALSLLEYRGIRSSPNLLSFVRATKRPKSIVSSRRTPPSASSTRRSTSTSFLAAIETASSEGG